MKKSLFFSGLLAMFACVGARAEDPASSSDGSLLQQTEAPGTQIYMRVQKCSITLQGREFWGEGCGRVGAGYWVLYWCVEGGFKAPDCNNEIVKNMSCRPTNVFCP